MEKVPQKQLTPEEIERKKKANERRKKRVLLLFLLFAFTVVIMVTATYAWFVGVTSVAVSNFTVTVKTDSDLLLSLDGTTFTSDLTVDKTAIYTDYTNSSGTSQNHNHWVKSTGLMPVSTSGEIDASSSELKLYNKAGMTATAGGYRFISNRIASGSGDLDYIVFDLYIKNGLGTTYDSTAAYNADSEEEIYLLKSSKVSANAAGDQLSAQGLSNSIRVAFAQIGRTANNASSDYVRTISCTDQKSGSTYNVMGLCTNKETTFWEPNDSVHSENAVAYFNQVCYTRTGATTYTTTHCTALTTRSSVPTWTVTKQISNTVGSQNFVDIYDGLNGYTVSSTYAIQPLTTLTDTLKNVEGQYRQPIFTLQPDSITKVRVYIYVEGQDVDASDLISSDSAVYINFGFTKDKFDTAQSDSTNSGDMYTFVMNGGSAPYSGFNPTTSEAFSIPTTAPTKQGYTFKEWNTKPDGSGTAYAAGASVKAAGTAATRTVFYAIWN